MSYNFVENITLEIPNVEEQLHSAFSEADRSNKGLIVEVAAIHAGETSNHTFYSKENLEAAVESWVTPYPKPVILNHDPHSEPVGRVIAAKMDKEADGTDFIRLQLAITDPTAVEKIVSQRYLTGSVGGKAEKATCSICGEDWAKASQFSAPCKHVRGRVYKGKRAFISMEGCSFKEYSWVNMPADALSGVREIGSVDGSNEDIDDDDWVRPARLFTLSMDSEEMFEYTEAESHDVLADMRRKDAQALHMQLKGAYLNALAVESSEEEEEDILSISEALSTNLAEAVISEEDNETPAEEENSEEEEEESSEESEEEEASEEENAEEGEKTDSIRDTARARRPEGQEKAHKRDIDPERSTGAPISRLSDETEDQIAENDDETELGEQIALLESQVEELEQAKHNLVEENARLRAALKRGLVERVVDTKIGLGMVDRENRGEEIEEHMSRSASSLADSLRDLVGLTPTRRVNDYREVPTVEENSKMGAVAGGAQEPVFNENEGDTTPTPINPEDFFTDVFMGRKKL